MNLTVRSVVFTMMPRLVIGSGFGSAAALSLLVPLQDSVVVVPCCCASAGSASAAIVNAVTIIARVAIRLIALPPGWLRGVRCLTPPAHASGADLDHRESVE